MTFDPKPGDRIKHKLSGTHYYYIGPVPHRKLETLVSADEDRSYTIEQTALHQYYEDSPEPLKLKADHWYIHNLTHGKYLVGGTFVSPEGEEITFAWHWSQSQNYYPTYIWPKNYSKYTEIKDPTNVKTWSESVAW